MGSKEKILKNKLFWASAAIASSLLFSQLVLGTPVSVSADTNESTSTQSTQGQVAAFHDMNQHSNESGAGMPNTNAANGVRTFSNAQNNNGTTQAAAQTNIQTFAANQRIPDNITIGDQSRPRADVVDVSNYQYWMTQADFNALHSLGVKGVVVELTDGTSFQNLYAAKQIQYAQNVGMTVSAYHFVRFGTNAAAVAEANHFANTLDQLNVGKQVNVVADVENINDIGDAGGNLNAFWQVLNQRG